MKISARPLSISGFRFNSAKPFRAFTVVEIMIAAAITVIMLGAIYQLFISGHKTFNAGTWMANLTQEIVVGFAQMQSDFKNTANLSANKPDNYYTAPEDLFAFNFNSKLLSPGGVSQPTDKLIYFSMCRRPQKKGFETKLDNQPAIIETVKYWLNDKRELCYQRKTVEWNGEPSDAKTMTAVPDGKVTSDRVLVHDVDSFKFVPFGTKTDIAPEEIFTIELKVVPMRAGREVKPLVKSTNVSVNVKVKKF